MTAEEMVIAEIAKLSADPEVRRGVASAAVCMFTEARAKLVAEIRTEQRYAKELSGVQDEQKLLVLQNFVRRADDGKKAALAELARLKKKPHACSDKTIASSTRCLLDSYVDGKLNDDACSRLAIAAAWDVLPPLRSPFLP